MGWNQDAGKILIYGGIVLLGIGLIVYLLGDKLSWIGRLPGDIRWKGEHGSFFFPLTSMILLSLLLTVLVNLLRRFL